MTDSNVNRPFIKLSPALRTIGQVQSKGTLDYNGLLVKFQRRFANNFSFLNSYTYGKAIDLNSDNDGTVTLTNVYDPGYNRGPADYDITHTFTSSWIYELPIARNKVYGGWQVSGIMLWRGGLPLTVTTTTGVQSTGTGNRPNRICDGSISNPTIDKWFDTSCFVAPTDLTGTYGNAGRNIIRGPGIVQHRRVAHQEHEDWTRCDRVSHRSLQRAEPSAVREPEHDGRECSLRHHRGDALEPVVRDLRHRRAAGAAGREVQVLKGEPRSGSSDRGLCQHSQRRGAPPPRPIRCSLRSQAAQGRQPVSAQFCDCRSPSADSCILLP